MTKYFKRIYSINLYCKCGNRIEYQETSEFEYWSFLIKDICSECLKVTSEAMLDYYLIKQYLEDKKIHSEK